MGNMPTDDVDHSPASGSACGWVFFALVAAVWRRGRADAGCLRSCVIVGTTFVICSDAQMDETVPHSPSVRSVLIGFVALIGVPVVILIDMLRVKLASWWTSSDLPQVLVALSSTVILVGVLLLATGAGRRRLVRMRARPHLGISRVL